MATQKNHLPPLPAEQRLLADQLVDHGAEVGQRTLEDVKKMLQGCLEKCQAQAARLATLEADLQRLRAVTTQVY